MSWFVAALKRYAVFGGRSRRKEYWYFVLFSSIITLVLFVIDGAIGTFDPSLGIGLLSGIFSLAILIPSIAVSIRRLHDIDRTGWWILLSFIPFIGTIVLLVFAVLDGTPGSNRFGPNPKTAVA
jgi:uncharacterized membrane protein YhaH (DUF805 family)